MTGRPCYEVEFADGTVIVADAEHQWLTDDRAGRRPAPASRDHRRELAAIAAVQTAPTATAPQPRGRGNARRSSCPTVDLPFPPYALGVLARRRPGRRPARSAPTRRSSCRRVRRGLRACTATPSVASRRRRPRSLSSSACCGRAWATSTSRRATCARPSAAARAAGRAARHRRHRAAGRLRAVRRRRNRRLARTSTSSSLSLGYRATLTTRRRRAGATASTSTRSPSRRRRGLPARAQAGCAQGPRRVTGSERCRLHRRRPAGAERAGALRPGRQRRPPLPRRAGRWIPTHNSTLGLDIARSARDQARHDHVHLLAWR